MAEPSMSENFTAPEQSAKRRPLRAKARHPPYMAMIKEAIAALREKSGSSRQKITKFIILHHLVTADVNKVKYHVKQALVKLTKEGQLIQTSGSGASGSFKLAQDVQPLQKIRKIRKTPSKRKPSISSAKVTPGKRLLGVSPLNSIHRRRSIKAARLVTTKRTPKAKTSKIKGVKKATEDLSAELVSSSKQDRSVSTENMESSPVISEQFAPNDKQHGETGGAVPQVKTKAQKKQVKARRETQVMSSQVIGSTRESGVKRLVDVDSITSELMIDEQHPKARQRKSVEAKISAHSQRLTESPQKKNIIKPNAKKKAPTRSKLRAKNDVKKSPAY